jgi:hypothetical protein
MRPEKIKAELDRLWNRYQEILNNPNQEDLNEARAILYLTGRIYCEKIAPEAIERRLHLLNKKLTLLDFLTLIDTQSKEPLILKKDILFQRLKKFYIIIKKYKNNFTGGKYHLDEEKFIKLYNRYNPEQNSKIGERGKFENKRRKKN